MLSAAGAPAVPDLRDSRAAAGGGQPWLLIFKKPVPPHGGSYVDGTGWAFSSVVCWFFLFFFFFVLT